MKTTILRLSLWVLAGSIGLVTVGCSDDAGTKDDPGNLTSELRKGSGSSKSATTNSSVATSNSDPSSAESATSTDAEDKQVESPSREAAKTTSASDDQKQTADKPADQPATPRYLKIQVVQGPEKGDLDVYVTNTWDKEITGCVFLPFEGIEIPLPKLIKPGQVAMCGLGGEIPENVTFQSDQFKDFQCEFPEPLEDLDVSKLDWAELDATASTTASDDDGDDDGK